MNQVEEKGIGWDTVEEKIKVSHQVLNLYTNSGPVPVTVEKSLKKRWKNLKAKNLIKQKCRPSRVRLEGDK
ncbi:MAG: hypothetical protein J7M20_05570 [Deltaproteobacteria bacterium]|nr:hypothetical protein [Deltaproteobacteria bacterium]